MGGVECSCGDFGGGWFLCCCRDGKGDGKGWDGMVVVSLLLILSNGGAVGMGTLWRYIWLFGCLQHSTLCCSGFRSIVL